MHDEYEVGIIGASVGSQGSSVSWSVGLVRKTEGVLSYETLDSTDTHKVLSLGAEEITLVVMPIAPNSGWGETFSYDYLFVEYEEPVPEPSAEPEGGPKLGCSHLKSADVLVWGLFSILFFVRRRDVFGVDKRLF